jgi:hypothetical protein
MSRVYSKSLWDTDDQGPMTEAAIRRLRGAPKKARVSRYTYDANDELEGTSRKCTGYVLEGCFILVTAESTTELKSGEVFEFSGGDYMLRIAAGMQAVVVWAWDLPPGL